MSGALVTGGSRGIGAATVRRFRESGRRVAFTYLAHEAEARALSEETGALAIRADAADPEQARRVAQRAEAEIGPIDALVINAGIAQILPIQDISDADWRQMIDTNLSGAFYAIRAALEWMLPRKRGSIAIVSSVWGVAGGSCESHYSAAKAGLIGLAKSLAKELAPSGINVNCIAPGVVETAMLDGLSPEEIAALRAEIPMDRFATPEEIARILEFFVSKDAAYITGQVIVPSGGFGI